MIGWIILAVILLLLFVLSLIRLGGRAKYGPEGFSAYVLAGPVRIQLIPSKNKGSPQKSKKRPKEKKEKHRKESAVQEEKSGTLGRVMKLLPVVCEAAGALKRKIRIDHLNLTVIWGADDPASAALGYGKANALLGMIWPLLDNNFKVKKCDWHIDVDYAKTVPEFMADAAITISIGQLISFAVHYGVKLFRNWKRSGKAPQQDRRQKV